MRPSRIGLLFALVTCPFNALAAPSKPSPHKVKETVIPPRRWIRHSVPAPDHTIALRIGLPQPNFHVLEKHLYEVSDPDHERYGAHLSKEEVEALVAPHEESVDLVDEWLQSHGIEEKDFVRSPAKDWVTLKLPVSLVEKMLDTVCSIPLHSISYA
jgi:tripeptidyl-peptidase-1